jgi:hypothetical protein
MISGHWRNNNEGNLFLGDFSPTGHIFPGGIFTGGIYPGAGEIFSPEFFLGDFFPWAIFTVVIFRGLTGDFFWGIFTQCPVVHSIYKITTILP